MSQSANVTSIDALKRFRLSVQQYDHESHAAITELVLELRRALQWLEVDRTRYWPNERRKAYDRVTEARVNLERKQLTIDPADSPACFEEKKALQAALARLRLTEEKIRIVQRWQVNCRQEADELQGQLTKLTSLLDLNLPRAVAALERIIRSLDAYAQRSSVTEAPPDSQTAHPSSQPQDPSTDRAE